jgi:hypothetical protein
MSEGICRFAVGLPNTGQCVKAETGAAHVGDCLLGFERFAPCDREAEQCRRSRI